MTHATPQKDTPNGRAQLGSLSRELFARALKLSKNRNDAEDLVQEAMERALRFDAQFEPGTNYRGWLHQILFSVFVTRCRRRRREHRALELLATDPNTWARPTPCTEAMALSPGVVGALEALPEHFSRVVKLVDLEELSYREAAEKLEVPVGTVMSRLFRGRKALANALEESVRPAA
jgi:RNA polymerase sigma-70 factor, ECF subfamily